MAFIDIGNIDEIPAGTMKSFTVKGKEILVTNYGGKFYAIGGRCTHMSGELAKGRLEGKLATCPRHGAQFDVTTGACVRGPKMGVFKLNAKDEPVYEVKVEGESIKVNI